MKTWKGGRLAKRGLLRAVQGDGGSAPTEAQSDLRGVRERT